MQTIIDKKKAQLEQLETMLKDFDEKINNVVIYINSVLIELSANAANGNKTEKALIKPIVKKLEHAKKCLVIGGNE